jgi:hypothetical protein
MAATGPLVDIDELRDALNVGLDEVSDEALQRVADATDGAILPHLRDGAYENNAAVREAAIAVAVQIWQARHAPGGQMVGIDLAPQLTPHLLGIGLLHRVRGLIGPYTAFGGAVVG